MHQPVEIPILTDGSPFADEVAHLIAIFVADTASYMEDGHSAPAVAAALSFVACLAAGQKPESPAFLKQCQRLARKYRDVKLNS